MPFWFRSSNDRGSRVAVLIHPNQIHLSLPAIVYIHRDMSYARLSEFPRVMMSDGEDPRSTFVDNRTSYCTSTTKLRLKYAIRTVYACYSSDMAYYIILIPIKRTSEFECLRSSI